MDLIQIELVTCDVTEIQADFILLKNAADGLVGPERRVNQVSGGMLALYNRSDLTKTGSVQLLSQVNGVAAKNIILIGVGSGVQLRYETLNMMCNKAAEAISTGRKTVSKAVIGTVSHGVGWGLDRKEVFTTQLFGFKKALEETGKPVFVEKIVFGDIEKQATFRQITYLEELVMLPNSPIVKQDGKFYLQLGVSSSVTSQHSSRLADSKYVFVAMPFAPEFENVYDYGMQLPIEQNGLLPVRTDKEFFVGSIMDEIKKRIKDSIFVVVDVTTLNPNVMFELGYAQGCDKPAIIICRIDQKLPFDVAGMNVIFYNPLLIRELNQALSTAIRTLMS